MHPLLTRPAHISPEEWERAHRDLATYRRELPRLLEEALGGKYALIKDDRVLSTWDTLDEALQVAWEQFGNEAVATYKINPIDVERYALLDR